MKLSKINSLAIFANVFLKIQLSVNNVSKHSAVTALKKVGVE